ncbi:MAG: UDP-glucose 4-epimerase GalE [Clostridia bacterium]|nr:UDP-glucose 4-epimerase GalE [Clostridia bacterium]
MSILLTGGAGFIGSHTAVELINAGYDVIIADNLSNSNEKVLNRIEAITGKRPKFYKTDISVIEDLCKIFDENNITGVIHFAGYKCVPESTKLPLKYYRNNLDTTLSLLEVMNKYNCNAIVFSSSATVYGDKNPVPFKEDMPIGGVTNAYGRTKLMIEEILTDVAVSDTDFSAVILRYFNPIGAHPSGLIGEAPDGIPNNLMPYVTQTAVGVREFLTIYGTDYKTHDGTGVRDYIHVVDLAKGHVAAIKYAMEHTGVEAINLGTGNGSSVLDVVNTFEKANEIKIATTIGKRRPGDIDECYASVDKAAKLLDWHAELTLEDMCKDSWNWQKNNPKGYEE